MGEGKIKLLKHIFALCSLPLSKRFEVWLDHNDHFVAKLLPSVPVILKIGQNWRKLQH